LAQAPGSRLQAPGVSYTAVRVRLKSGHNRYGLEERQYVVSGFSRTYQRCASSKHLNWTGPEPGAAFQTTRLGRRPMTNSRPDDQKRSDAGRPARRAVAGGEISR
jgi:hypothetical protein